MESGRADEGEDAEPVRASARWDMPCEGFFVGAGDWCSQRLWLDVSDYYPGGGLAASEGVPVRNALAAGSNFGSDSVQGPTDDAQYARAGNGGV